MKERGRESEKAESSVCERQERETLIALIGQVRSGPRLLDQVTSSLSLLRSPSHSLTSLIGIRSLSLSLLLSLIRSSLELLPTN